MDSNVDFEENEILELKKSTSELKESIISIAVILNKHRKGELYFGIKNDGSVERWGTGIRRIYEECTENDVKVEFRKEKGGFSTVFYRSPGYGGAFVGTTGNQFPEKVPRRSSEKTSEKIILLIKENPSISAKEIAEKLGVSPRAIEMQIAKLKKNNIITRIGPAKGGHWEVVGK